MTNEQLEILKIKNLKIIFFYRTNDGSSILENGELLGLKIIYDNDKSLNYDYTSPYFTEFVSKVLTAYQKEKDTNKIHLLDDLTKEIVQSYNQNSYSPKEKTLKFYQENEIVEFGRRKEKLESPKNYMFHIFKDILTFFHENQIKLEKITGNQDRYLLSYQSSEINFLVPFVLIQKGYKQYYFKISGIHHTSEIIEGEIAISGGNVNIDWNTKNSGIITKEIFRFLPIHEKSIYKNDKILSFENEVNKIPEPEQIIIQYYLNLLGLEALNEGLKTSQNNYIFGKVENIERVNSDPLQKELSAHIFLGEKDMDISYLTKCGLVKYDGNFIFPIYSELEDIKIRLIDIDEKSYLIVQNYYVPTDKMNGTYSGHTNQYTYQIFEVNCCNQLTKVNQIIKNIEIKQNVHTIGHIKQYIKRKEN